MSKPFFNETPASSENAAFQPQQPMTYEIPQSAMPPSSSRGGRGKAIMVLLAAILLAGGAYAATAYYMKLWPFMGTSIAKELAFADLFAKTLSIQSSSYELKADVKIEPRTAGLTSFELSFPELEAQRALYERDADRFRALNETLTGLWSYQRQYSKYPSSLDDLNGPAFLGGQNVGPKFDGAYTVDSTGGDFSLTISFETTDAIRMLQQRYQDGRNNGIEINGKVAILHKEMALQYTSFYFSAEPTKPAWISVIENQDSTLRFLPSEFAGDLVVGGTTQRDSNEKTDFKFHAGVNWTFGDLTAAADGELWKKADSYYGRISKFPSIGFFDISKIKGTWVKITQEDLLNSGSSWTMTYAEDGQKKFSTTLGQVQTAFRLLKEENAVAVDFSLPDQTIEKRSVYVYKISINEANVGSWYERVATELQKEYGPEAIIKFDEATVSILKSESFKKYLAYVKSITSTYIYVDAQTGYPVRFAYDIVYVPDDTVTNLDGKQVSMHFALDIKDINKPVTVDEPTPSITYEEAYLRLSGQSKEAYQFNRQQTNISALRAALKGYHDYTGQYPESLAKLTTPRNQLTKKQTSLERRPWIDRLLGIFTARAQVSIDFPTEFSEFSDQSYLDAENEYYTNQTAEQKKKLEESPFLKTVPKDVYTGKEYSYSLSPDDGYRLGYEMRYPPRQKERSTDDYFSYSNTVSINEVLDFISGANTATATSLSVEAVAALKSDSDTDGLPDSVEHYYGSDKNKADSDGDGYNDYSEVQKGYDPAGPGKLDYYDIWRPPYKPTSYDYNSDTNVFPTQTGPTCTKENEKVENSLKCCYGLENVGGSCVKGKPDLTVRSITRTGTGFDIKVCNDGRGESPSYQLNFKSSSYAGSYITMHSLAPETCASEQLYYSNLAVKPKWSGTVTAEVDTINAIAEKNESNNSLAQPFTINLTMGCKEGDLGYQKTFFSNTDTGTNPIQFSAPKKDEVVPLGKPYLLSWQSKNLDSAKISIYIYDACGLQGTIANNIKNEGNFTWNTSSVNFTTINGELIPLQAGNYSLTIVAMGEAPNYQNVGQTRMGYFKIQ